MTTWCWPRPRSVRASNPKTRSARKKIEQLNEFIRRFGAGTRSSQVTSRKKEVERLQTSDLARSNIARPYIRFENLRPSGRHPLEIKGLIEVLR